VVAEVVFFCNCVTCILLVGLGYGDARVTHAVEMHNALFSCINLVVYLFIFGKL
jgi:hypothetical protein